MKKTKHLVALILTVALLMLSTTTSFAVDDMDGKISEIYHYFSESVSTYGLYGVPEIQPPVDGEVYLTYTSDSVKEYEDTLRYTNNLINAYYDNEKEVTVQDLDNCMTKMLEAEKGLTLERENLSFLIDMCMNETNSNNYYSSEVWNKFTESFVKAQAVIEDESITDLRVNEAYWELFNSFTSLCVYNKLAGDVNFDGKVNVRDATLIQRGIAQLSTLNVSQVHTANVAGTSYEINIRQATHIQKYVAGMTDNLNNNDIENLSEIEGNVNAHNYKVNRYFYQALFRSSFPF